MRQQLVMPVLISAAEKLGLKLLVEPTRGMYAAILFDNGKKFYLKDINFNLNPGSSASLAKNKAATSWFLQKYGYRVPEFTMIFSAEKCKWMNSQDSAQAGFDYATTLGLPVILKPNAMSQGSFIFKAFNADDYFSAAAEIFKHTHTAQVQKFYPGSDYRIVVLGNQILSAYQRIPLRIIGDGVSTIAKFIDQKQKFFVEIGRDTKLDPADVRIARILARTRLSLDSIPPAGDQLYLQDISNLSIGGDTLDLTAEIHLSFAELAVNIARDMNLPLCGIDLITRDLTQPNDGAYIVLEVNSAPGLDNYAFHGAKQVEYVEDLYKQVLLYIKDQYS